MDEDSVDRLCGLIARLRQQHAALGATLDEIEVCLAGMPPESSVEQSQPIPELPRRAPPDRGSPTC